MAVFGRGLMKEFDYYRVTIYFFVFDLAQNLNSPSDMMNDRVNCSITDKF
jgi:hypothetical protein